MFGWKKKNNSQTVTLETFLSGELEFNKAKVLEIIERNNGGFKVLEDKPQYENGVSKRHRSLVVLYNDVTLRLQGYVNDNGVLQLSSPINSIYNIAVDEDSAYVNKRVDNNPTVSKSSIFSKR